MISFNYIIKDLSKSVFLQLSTPYEVSKWRKFLKCADLIPVEEDSSVGSLKSSLINIEKIMTSTARCTTQTNIFSIAATNLKAMFDQNPKLGYLMMGRLAEIISQRLQTRTEKLIEAWGEAFGLAKI